MAALILLRDRPWAPETGITSPMGHGTLESLVLVPVRAMRTVADDWREENGLPRGAGEWIK